MVNDLRAIFGKFDGSEPVVHVANGRAPMWKKKSMFWELPYWEILEVRNAIDVMHLTKNLCLNVLGFLGCYGSSKDTLEARRDVTPSFKGKTECIDHVCARIKLHTRLDFMNTKISATRIKSYYKP
jgi:hypothetical protein